MPADRSFPKRRSTRPGVILRPPLYHDSHYPPVRSLGRDWVSIVVNERLHDAIFWQRERLRDMQRSGQGSGSCRPSLHPCETGRDQFTVRPGHREGGDFIKVSLSNSACRVAQLIYPSE